MFGLARMRRNCGWPSRIVCRLVRPSTVMLDSIRSSSSAGIDRFCASSTISRQRLPTAWCWRSTSSKRCSSPAFPVPSSVRPNPAIARRNRSPSDTCVVLMRAMV